MSSIEKRILDEFLSLSTGVTSHIGQAATGARSEGQSVLASVFSTVLKSGLGISPLVGGLLGLFGADDSETPEPLTKYSLPASLELRRMQTASGVYGYDYDQSGNLRTVGNPEQRAPGMKAGQQVTVNIQAMDARSFLDRSSDIAAAVRDAVLNLSSLNDVISEL